MSRISAKDRVRHIDGREGTVDEVEIAMGHVWVVVHLDNGGTERSGQGYWERLPAISKHIANIYAEEELEESGTLSKMETVQIEGERAYYRSGLSPIRPDQAADRRTYV